MRNYTAAPELGACSTWQRISCARVPSGPCGLHCALCMYTTRCSTPLAFRHTQTVCCCRARHPVAPVRVVRQTPAFLESSPAGDGGRRRFYRRASRARGGRRGSSGEEGGAVREAYGGGGEGDHTWREEVIFDINSTAATLQQSVLMEVLPVVVA